MAFELTVPGEVLKISPHPPHAFSARTARSMLAFYREYPSPGEFVQEPLAQLTTPVKVPQPVAQLPWRQNIAFLFLEKHKERGYVG
jgi:hypothetical protein